MAELDPDVLARLKIGAQWPGRDVILLAEDCQAILDALGAEEGFGPGPTFTFPLPEPLKRKPTTRRVHNGTVHEMADLGAGTMCERELPEPWTHTDAPVNCNGCLARLARSRSELQAALKWVNPPERGSGG